MAEALNNQELEFYNQTQNKSDFMSDEVQMISTVNPVSEELDGIGILVSMAKNGKIDPWNIDIVDVLDKYMLEIKENNLRLTGRTLLFASILLKLKSNILVGLAPEQFETPEVDFIDDNDDDWDSDDYEMQMPVNNVVSFDEVLQRRTSVRLNRNRVVTLDDLIRHLEFYAELDKKQSLKSKIERSRRRVQSYAKFTADDIINLAHDEYIEKSVKVLEDNLEKIFEKEQRVSLEALSLLGLDKISAYVALLFLSINTDYEIVQDEFYSEIFVIKSQGKDYIEEIA